MSLIGNCINHKPLKIHSGLICGAESALLEIVGVEERQRCVETKKCEARQPRCARPAPALSPPPDQAKPPSASAPIPSSIVRPRACEQQSAKKEMSTAASSRSTAQPAGAGRSASGLAGIGARLARERILTIFEKAWALMFAHEFDECRRLRRRDKEGPQGEGKFVLDA